MQFITFAILQFITKKWNKTTKSVPVRRLNIRTVLINYSLAVNHLSKLTYYYYYCDNEIVS